MVYWHLTESKKSRFCVKDNGAYNNDYWTGLCFHNINTCCFELTIFQPSNYIQAHVYN